MKPSFNEEYQAAGVQFQVALYNFKKAVARTFFVRMIQNFSAYEKRIADVNKLFKLK